MSSNPVLVLDIDGVVSIAQPPWHTGLKQDIGLDYEELVRDFFRKDWGEVVRGRLDLFQALQPYLEGKGMAERMEEFVGYWFEKDAVIDWQLLALADAWRTRTGGRVFAATNQEHHRAAYLRDTVGIGKNFDEIVYSAALGCCKPERVFFTNAQARMGISAAQSILFVDDSTANVDGARMAGWRAMLYRDRDSLGRALAGWG